jgi:predicted Zn-dependent peptidase
MIAVKTGSKNDPADHTGLAHYLEHMMFKGTDQYGSKDFSKEKPYLDEIENLYETYGAEKDEDKRKAIYHVIDSVSGLAAKWAIANEYDKMVSNIGAKGTNAFTSNDMTVYVNDIPVNQIEKWVNIEAERFRNPQLRLFHTELEAVYEEKNRGLDNDGRKANEAMMASLFKNHAYGTQTTIGTIEHLKSPSIKAIKKYYNERYVPNNMAIIISGDVDPDKTAELIKAHFSYMQPKPLVAYPYGSEKIRSTPDEITVYGPDAEEVSIGFRMKGSNTSDYLLQTMIDNLLNNASAGLLDLDLVKQQKVIEAQSGIDNLTDYDVFELTAKPVQGQSLEDCKNLLLAEIDKLKKGDFDEGMIAAGVTNMKVQEMRSLESNGGRAYTIMNTFVHDIDYNAFMHRFDVMSKFTKADIMSFANSNFTNDYTVVYKKVGEDKTTKKVVKPAITPVAVNREDQSEFLKKIIGMKTESIKPVFVDYNKDIAYAKSNNGVPIWYVNNHENSLFSLFYAFDMGTLTDKTLGMMSTYFDFLGTKQMSSEKISTEMYKLGCRFDVNVGRDNMYVSINGPQDKMQQAIALFEDVLNNCVANDDALKQLVDNVIKERNDAKKNKNVIRQRLMDYANYGANNPSTFILNNEELKKLKAQDLVDKIHNLKNYQHRIYYYGPMDPTTFGNTISRLHQVAAQPQPVPALQDFKRKDMNENEVYFVDYPMVQAEIMWTHKGDNWNVAQYPDIRLFNEYFGGSMSGIVFQTIRESKALAYSTYARYNSPSRKEDPFYMTAYVGTQADKFNDATKGMNELLTDLPASEKNLQLAKDAIKNQIESERITKTGLLMNNQNNMKLGINYDIRKNIYDKLPTMTMTDVNNFFNKDVKDKKYFYCVLASSKKVSKTDLEKIGKVTELKLEDIFGY